MNEKANATHEVTVLVDGHTHAGKPVAKGDRLKVSKPVADWMVEKKIAAHSGGAVRAQQENR